MKINNRRYLGNKYKLLSFIQNVVDTECKDVKTVFDVFSGTGAVASAFADRTVIVNDILYSNHLAHIAWFSPDKFSKKIVESFIKKYNSTELGDDVENYMTINFADTYFSKKVCAKIGYIREDIEESYSSGAINDKERAMLITSLIYALDKIANTCGHYDAYRKGATYTGQLILDYPEPLGKLSKNNKCYNEDSNILAKSVSCDLAYLDPPYNSRQYCDAYHLLENVAKWEKPEVVGVARKMDRTALKSDYCTNSATKAFDDLVTNLKCKYILLSYNNTADTADGRSNARIKDDDIMRILSKRGKVKVFTTKYKAFTAGKSENDRNEERLFLCVVNDDEIIKSPLNYTGGKGKLLPQIKPLFPSNISTFVDLFCGGATVGANVMADKNIYNDIQSLLVGLLDHFSKCDKYKFIASVERIIEKYDLSNSSVNGYDGYDCNGSDGLGKYNKPKYDKLKSDFNSMKKSAKEYYAMFFTLIVYAFNNQIRFNNSGEFNLPVGKRDFNKNVRMKLEKFIDRLQSQNTEFSSLNFRDFDISKLDKDSFVYCDPPYLISTASYNEKGGWTDKDELDLLDFLNKLNKRHIKFALSNVTEHKGRINQILIDWANSNNYTIHNLNYDYSNSNYHAKNTDKKTQEVLITNY